MTTAPRSRSSHSVEVLELRVAPAGVIAAAGGGLVALFTDPDADNTYDTKADGITPFPGYKGRITVAMGDFDGDGNDELVTAQATPKAAAVRVWDITGAGHIGVLLDEFVPFPATKNRGVTVAAGDIDGDGRAELIVGAGPRDAASVQIYSDVNSDTKLSDNLEDTLTVFPAGFRGGVSVAAGNTDNVAGAEIVAASRSGGGSVAIFKDANGNRKISDDNLGAAFETFSPFGADFRKGLNVAAGEIQNIGGNGAEVIVGTGKGRPEVRIFTDANADGKVGDSPAFDTLLPAGPGHSSGAVVAAGDTDNSAFFVEVIVGPGAGAGAHVKIFDDGADAGAILSDEAPTFEFDAFARLKGGLNLAFGKERSGTFSFPGFPQTIPDVSTLNSSFVVPSGAGRIVDLDVSLNIQHSFNGDLDVSLTHVPSTRTLVLFNDVGGSNEGFQIRLNDEAGTDISGASNPKADGPITGTFNPGGSALLSIFDGIDASGEWRLTIVDDAGGDNGTLFGWSLHLTV